jgi:uncharacterized damage-inducible protein DinB
MGEARRIAGQLRRAFEGQAWHGPSLREILDGVSAEQASARPLAGAHSIWEIVLHIAAWEDAVRRRLLGERAELSEEEDWPKVSATDEAAWAATLAALAEGNLRLREEISRLDDTRLPERVSDGMASIYGTLHGVVQHTLYHAGQIALLKKA